MKIHTRKKRKYGLTTTFRHINFFIGGHKAKKGERTFKSKEAADKWATEKLGLKAGEYKLVPAKKDKKVKIEKI